jgi:hypothetical protein
MSSAGESSPSGHEAALLPWSTHTSRPARTFGVEGLGFVPRALGRGAAYFSDLGAPGSPTEGNDSLLVLRGQDLARAGLVVGDLVVATEAGARTLAVRCARRCTVRQVAAGPTTTHGEGHITFVPESN